jgi:molybdopterin molybdotransferase
VLNVTEADFEIQRAVAKVRAKLFAAGIEVASQAREQALPLEKALGQHLSRPLLADRDYPPFDRVAMDGIALPYSAWQKGQRLFPVEAVHKAGDAKIAITKSEACIEVMTGSILPDGTDSVIPYELLRIENKIAHLSHELIKLGQNIHRQGTDCRKGEVMVEAQTRLRVPHIGIAASIGAHEVFVQRQPRIALVSTGDELVAIEAKPLEHQIRTSNVYAIKSLLLANGFNDCVHYHLGDTDEDKHLRLKNILSQADFLVLSGGVSAGKFDFVPEVLVDLGARKIFHKIKQKPGKPLWFGIGAQEQLIFGLPGNPVSSLLCARRYLVPALRAFCGNPAVNESRARLAQSVSIKNEMTLFPAVKISIDEQATLVATILENNGSGDFASLAASDGFIELSGLNAHYPQGSVVPLFQWSPS